MRVQQPVRDRNLSLQQSALREALTSNPNLSQEEKREMERTASVRAQSLEKKEKDVAAGAQPQTAPASADAGAEHGPLLDWLFRNYSMRDTGWLKAGWLYVKYYVLAHLPPTYRSWRGVVTKDISYGVIKYRLPSQCRVLVVGDWGTHMPDNAALLRQAVKKCTPTAIIHLGDVYYSGTVEECTANVLDVMDNIFPEGGARTPFFAIPGNHDYYAGGGGFYHTIDNVNSRIADCKQEASYFCLRTADDKWQFLGMDTGYNDRVPTDQLFNAEGPDLRDDEMEWHKDKLENFAGSTILLSHHQLISAREQLNKTSPNWLNGKLYRKFSPYFDRISAWYWGHEHNLILFENNLAVGGHTPALKMGRLLGCSAYEESIDSDPFEVKYSDARFIHQMPKLGRSPYLTGGQSFYNHAFAILDVSPGGITATYHEYPSWGLNNHQPTDPPIGDHHFYQEQISPR